MPITDKFSLLKLSCDCIWTVNTGIVDKLLPQHHFVFVLAHSG